MVEINWASQGLAALSSLVIGYIWYGLIFPKQWLSASGLTEEKIKKGYHPALLYGMCLLLTFVFSMGLKMVIVDIHKAFDPNFQNNFGHGAFHGTMISIVMGAVPVLVVNALYDQRNWKYILINVGYWILTFAIMGGIIGAMA